MNLKQLRLYLAERIKTAKYNGNPELVFSIPQAQEMLEALIIATWDDETEPAVRGTD